MALGIFISGVCPGGGVSNIYSHLLDGDLSLSITMTTISTIAALGNMDCSDTKKLFTKSKYLT